MGGGIAIWGDRIFAEKQADQKRHCFVSDVKPAPRFALWSSAAGPECVCSISFARAQPALPKPSALSKCRIKGFAVKERVRCQNHLTFLGSNCGWMRHRAFDPG